MKRYLMRRLRKLERERGAVKNEYSARFSDRFTRQEMTLWVRGNGAVEVPDECESDEAWMADVEAHAASCITHEEHVENERQRNHTPHCVTQ